MTVGAHSIGGFTLVQLAVAVLASDAARLMKVRLAGATVAGIGLVLFVGHVEGVLSGHPVTTAAVKGDSSSTKRSFTASGEGMWHAAALRNGGAQPSSAALRVSWRMIIAAGCGQRNRSR